MKTQAGSSSRHRSNRDMGRRGLFPLNLLCNSSLSLNLNLLCSLRSPSPPAGGRSHMPFAKPRPLLAALRVRLIDCHALQEPHRPRMHPNRPRRASIKTARPPHGRSINGRPGKRCQAHMVSWNSIRPPPKPPSQKRGKAPPACSWYPCSVLGRVALFGLASEPKGTGTTLWQQGGCASESFLGGVLGSSASSGHPSPKLKLG